MRGSHPLLLAAGGVLATVGGAIVAVFVGVQATAKQPFHLWHRGWFLAGFSVMLLGLLVLGGVLLDYAVRVKRGEGSWGQLWERVRRLQSPIIWRGFARRQIAAGLVRPDSIGEIQAGPPDAEPQEPTPSWEELNRVRVGRYEDNRGLFLVHDWYTPSQEPGQVADVTIRLKQHREGPLSRGEIRAVEYTLGPQFTDHSLVRMDPTDDYAIHVPMWDTMLCLAKVYFTDSSQPLLLERYINFDQDAEPEQGGGATNSIAAPTFTVTLAPPEQTQPSPEPRYTVYARVSNSGPSAAFIAQITRVDGAVTRPPVPWTCKWRESDERKMMIHRGSSELLELFESVPMGHEPQTDLRPALLIAKSTGQSAEMRPRVEQWDDLYEKDIGFTLEVRNTLADEAQSFALTVGIEKDLELSPRVTLAAI
jgi:hypothetical protein